MKGLLVTGAVLASVALAACGGSSGSSGGGSMAGTGSSKVVSVEHIGSSGNVLVDAKGRALYTPDQEMNGKVLCTGACTSIWMPATVSGAKASSLSGNFTVVNRPDGKKQVAYKGRPLYTFSQDTPGQVTGDGAMDAFGGRHFTWHVVTTGKASKSSSSGSSSATKGSYGY
jgi:predicted lipoprotein with Yx(FWY)xxD motif